MKLHGLFSESKLFLKDFAFVGNRLRCQILLFQNLLIFSFYSDWLIDSLKVSWARSSIVLQFLIDTSLRFFIFKKTLEDRAQNGT